MIISVDDNSEIDFIPSKCSICLDVICRDTISFSCLRCQEKICYKCIINIMELGQLLIDEDDDNEICSNISEYDSENATSEDDK